MRLLLDTQIMLWWLLDDQRLNADTRQFMRLHPALVSVASLWEVAINLYGLERRSCPLS
jgi:PIN domain nuclease of toxin-antitoxin system